MDVLPEVDDEDEKRRLSLAAPRRSWPDLCRVSTSIQIRPAKFFANRLFGWLVDLVRQSGSVECSVDRWEASL